MAAVRERPRLFPFFQSWTALLALAANGCTPNYRADDRYVGDHYIELDAAGQNVNVRLRGQVGWAGSVASSAPRLLADVDRCRVVEDDDGLSRLDYPSGSTVAGARPHVGLTIALEAGPETDGSLDLVRSADKPHRFSQNDDALAVLVSVPVFVVQPLEVLPDRHASALTGSDPAAPALVELARDLVDCRAVAVAGSVRAVGDFAAQMSLTGAGRAKLRAALARHDAATRPAPAGPSSLPAAVR